MSNMWLPPDQDPRERRPWSGEKDTVLGYLRNYRTTFELKCSGLSHDQLARRSVPPSSLSLLGLLRHLAKVEHHWSTRVLQGVRDSAPHRTQEYWERDFEGAVADPAVVEEAWESWRRESAAADAWYAADDWDRRFDKGGQYEVRGVVVHVLEEYARHVGHADLLRECIDGRTGQ